MLKKIDYEKKEAIIKKTKFQEVKDTLHESGIDFFSFFPVTGVGKATQSRVLRWLKPVLPGVRTPRQPLYQEPWLKGPGSTPILFSHW
jgi:hypothetical protein